MSPEQEATARSPLSNERRAFTILEFAEIFGISRSSVYNLIERGEVRPVKILGRTAFTRAEVERFSSSLDAQIASEGAA